MSSIGCVLPLAALAGCSNLPAYRCTANVQCTVNGAAGFCEATGWCSMPDPGCDSQRRYVAEAGDGLAGLCVEQAPPDGPASDAATPSDAMPAADAFDLTGGWSSPVAVPMVNSTEPDDDPTLTGDLLELYFSSLRPGSAGGKDIWVAKRLQPGDPFGTPVEVPEINTPDDDDVPEISFDGLTLRFSRSDAGDTTGMTTDTFVAQRQNRSEPWVVTPTPDLDSPGKDYAPVVVRGGTRAYLCSVRSGQPSEDIYVADRSSPGGSFGMAARQQQLSTGEDECSPWVNESDTLVILHASRAGSGPPDLFWSARSDPAEPYPAPLRLDEVSSAAELDEDPWLSPDGRLLFFVRSQPGAMRDIFWATRD